MAVWWTKRSRFPSSGVMKPKPFSSLNHFTVPDGTCDVLHASCAATCAEGLTRSCERLHLLYDRVLAPALTRRTLAEPRVVAKGGISGPAGVVARGVVE